MEPDQIDVLASTVLGDLEEVDHALETRLAGELRCNVRETDRLDRIHLDLPVFHGVTGAFLDVGTEPYTDAARDVSATNPLTQSLGEDHEKSLRRQCGTQGREIVSLGTRLFELIQPVLARSRLADVRPP